MTTHVPNTFSRKYTIFSPQVRHREYDNRKTGRNLPAPLHTRRTSGHAAQRIRQNNNYPFWTSRSHTWFVAWEGENVYGFVPVEITDNGIARINNYYVSGDDPQLLARFLREVVRYYGRDYTIRSVTLIRHAEIFRTEGFAAIREWKQYVAMQYDNKRPQP